jgi:GNAT superfamily N-acetyltransferase
MNSAANITTELAGTHEHQLVGGFVCSLLKELFPEQASNFHDSVYVAAAVKLLGNATCVWAILAKKGDTPVGAIVLNECAAIYAGGAFGEISELYVLPQFRSMRVGEFLLAAADKFAVTKGWPFLEVGTPGLPRWQRTVDFYLENGFSEIGPRLERNTGM